MRAAVEGAAAVLPPTRATLVHGIDVNYHPAPGEGGQCKNSSTKESESIHAQFGSDILGVRQTSLQECVPVLAKNINDRQKERWGVLTAEGTFIEETVHGRMVGSPFNTAASHASERHQDLEKASASIQVQVPPPPATLPSKISPPSPPPPNHKTPPLDVAFGCLGHRQATVREAAVGFLHALAHALGPKVASALYERAIGNLEEITNWGNNMSEVGAGHSGGGTGRESKTGGTRAATMRSFHRCGGLLSVLELLSIREVSPGTVGEYWERLFSLLR